MTKKNILLTGGLGFIGSHFCNLLTKNNFKVFIFDIKDEKKIKNKKNIEYYKVNIADEDSVVKIYKKLSSINFFALINNAAIDSVPKKTNSLNHLPKINQWNHEINVSLTGSYLITKYFGEKIKNSNKGKIIFMGSDLSVVAPNQKIYKDFGNFLKPVTYSVIKHGMIGLTKYFASLYSINNIQVNMLSPGPIKNKHNIKFVKSVSDLIPMNRMGNLKDLDETLLFLLNNNNNFLTGQNIVVDGGRTLV